mmetsp:Transcript_31945/g.51215  ORF Transcript_31945/g.51215 Transcript_31945/m.51215 type:complete len:199 (-) Transcript_31945:1809-2405(-)
MHGVNLPAWITLPADHRELSFHSISCGSEGKLDRIYDISPNCRCTSINVLRQESEVCDCLEIDRQPKCATASLFRNPSEKNYLHWSSQRRRSLEQVISNAVGFYVFASAEKEIPEKSAIACDKDLQRDGCNLYFYLFVEEIHYVIVDDVFHFVDAAGGVVMLHAAFLQGKHPNRQCNCQMPARTNTPCVHTFGYSDKG